MRGNNAWSTAGLWLVAWALVLGSPALALAQIPNVAIQSWSPPISVTSPYVNVLDLTSVVPDYFAASPELSTNKADLAIYVRFDNNSLAVIPDGGVKVTAEYAAAAPNLAAGDVAAAVAALPAAAWHDFGSYTMSLVIPAGAPPGYGLTSGSYPTSHEITDPARYRVVCSSDCAAAMPTSFFLRITLACSTTPAETDTSDNEALSYYDLGIPPSDVVILHDVSGSMSGSLALAQQRAKMFVDLLNIGDRVGVVAFSGDLPGGTEIKKSLGVPIASLDPSDPAKANAKVGIDSFSAGGVTPMGEGVLKAQEVLDDLAAAPYASNRAIVMLTDGMENSGTHRLQDPPSYPIILGPTGLNNDANGAIGLYPLWFGPLGSWGLSLLQDIDTHTTLGKIVDQPSDDLKLAEAYLMIRGILTSDDVYDIHRGSTGDGYEGSLWVDPITNELILAAAWQDFERHLEIEVRPPGSRAWVSAAAVGGIECRDHAYVVHRIAEPESGRWRYRLVKEDEGEQYVLSALADRVAVLMQSSLKSKAMRAGEPIKILARLSRSGKGVPGAMVTATVQVPKVALGTILNEVRDKLRTPLDPKLPVDVPRAAAIRKELRELVGDDDLIGFHRERIVLKDLGNGTYTGTWPDTQVAGSYDITIVAESQRGSVAGELRREHHHAAVVTMGKIDVKRSPVEVRPVPDGVIKDRVIVRIWLAPTDVTGNYLSPGYAGHIIMRSTAGEWRGPVRDHDDGSYSRDLLLRRDETAEVWVSVLGSKLEPIKVTPDRMTIDPRQIDPRQIDPRQIGINRKPQQQR